MLWALVSVIIECLFFHGPFKNTELEAQSHLIYLDPEERLELGSQFKYGHIKFCPMAWGGKSPKGVRLEAGP